MILNHCIILDKIKGFYHAHGEVGVEKYVVEYIFPSLHSGILKKSLYLRFGWDFNIQNLKSFFKIFTISSILCNSTVMIKFVFYVVAFPFTFIELTEVFIIFLFKSICGLTNCFLVLDYPTNIHMLLFYLSLCLWDTKVSILCFFKTPFSGDNLFWFYSIIYVVLENSFILFTEYIIFGNKNNI